MLLKQAGTTQGRTYLTKPRAFSLAVDAHISQTHMSIIARGCAKLQRLTEDKGSWVPLGESP